MCQLLQQQVPPSWIATPCRRTGFLEACFSQSSIVQHYFTVVLNVQVLYDSTLPALSGWTTTIDTTLGGSPTSPLISLSLVFSEPIAWAREAVITSNSSSNGSGGGANRTSSITIINAELVNVTSTSVNGVNTSRTSGQSSQTVKITTALTRGGVLAADRYTLLLKALPGVKVEVLLPQGSFLDVAGNAAAADYGMMVGSR
jgi:hypothetical protein